MLRFLLPITLIVCQAGCYKETIPILPPVARITATLHPLPALRISGIELVEIPASEHSQFLNLVTPSKRCSQEEGIARRPEVYYLVADVFLEHKDGSKSDVRVRWTGHNPAAVSLDGKKYYYGGTDPFPDSATRIMRLLREYDYAAQKSPFNESPIVRITATLHTVSNLEIEAIQFVEVPSSELSKFAVGIVPNKPSVQEQGILARPDVYCHVADVEVEHKDGTKSELIVRWTGKNLAAISLDGSKYYDGGSDAMSIVRLLQEYDARELAAPGANSGVGIQ